MSVYHSRDMEHNLTLLLHRCCLYVTANSPPAASLLVSGDPDKGRPLAEQETLATSINRLVGLLGQAQQYVDDVVVSWGADVGAGGAVCCSCWCCLT